MPENPDVRPTSPLSRAPPRGCDVKFYLIVAKGKHRGTPIPIEVDLFMIGGDQLCQLRCQHPEVAGQHCALVSRGKKVFVQDLGSDHPTLVNGSPIPPGEEWPLHKGDRLAVGPLEFLVNIREKAAGSRKDLEDWASQALDEDTGPKKSAVQEIYEAAGVPERFHDEAAKAAAALIDQLQARKGTVRGRLRISKEGEVTVVRILDAYLVESAELTHLRRELEENLGGKGQRVLLDCKDVRRMSTAGVFLFAQFAQWLRQRSSTVAVCRLRPELESMMSDMRDVCPVRVFREKDAAVAAWW